MGSGFPAPPPHRRTKGPSCGRYGHDHLLLGGGGCIGWDLGLEVLRRGSSGDKDQQIGTLPEHGCRDPCSWDRAGSWPRLGGCPVAWWLPRGLVAALLAWHCFCVQAAGDDPKGHPAPQQSGPVRLTRVLTPASRVPYTGSSHRTGEGGNLGCGGIGSPQTWLEPPSGPNLETQIMTITDLPIFKCYNPGTAETLNPCSQRALKQPHVGALLSPPLHGGGSEKPLPPRPPAGSDATPRPRVPTRDGAGGKEGV